MVEEQRDAKNASMIPDDETPKDSIVGLISSGDQPSLELYRGSSLMVFSHNAEKRIDRLLEKEVSSYILL
ncbi:hypothetical protein B296_00000481 [Ensete ventricosum]|uniref:Uncharacterized protein n=1 Tax=Ensete ventricosum TaxID=4639 RepID=A0A426ZEP5_ENSVE|nr:hypothetical protein B296_00000481 [Ensete ventricosum]